MIRVAALNAHGDSPRAKEDVRTNAVGMFPNEAKDVLKDTEAILQLVSRYHQLSEEQQLALHSRAGQARQKIDGVLKLLKRVIGVDR